MKFSGSRIAIYARYSSDNQRDASIDDQVRVCSQHIQSNGGTVDRSRVFMDRGVSGLNNDRSGFEALMGAVRQRSIDTIVVEDLSRLSRDYALCARLYVELSFAGVRLIGVADGLDTSAPGAMMNFAVRSALANDFIEQLRHKTRRGLVGRAENGLSTGGRLYGYASTTKTDPGGRPIGYTLEIHRQRADTVRWIFEEYRDGRSLGAITYELNRRAVEPPRAQSKHRRQGWVDGTVRGILRNPKYVGVWTFNNTTWEKNPDTSKRRPRKLPQTDVVTVDRPDLRIIEPELWEAVQRRLRAVSDIYTKRRTNTAQAQRPDSDGRTRVAAGRPSRYPLSSVLVCGTCGNPMTITGGSSAAYYRCSFNKKRGTCSNAITVREDVARARILVAIRDLLARPEGVEHARQQIAEQLGEVGRSMSSALDQCRARLDNTKAEIERLVRFIASGYESAAVAEQLKEREAHARADKATIAELEREAVRPVRLPSVDEVLQDVFDINASLTADPVAGREHLRALLKGGQIVLTPGEDGVYVATSEVLPMMLIRKNDNAGSGTGPKPAWSKHDSGGRI